MALLRDPYDLQGTAAALNIPHAADNAPVSGRSHVQLATSNLCSHLNAALCVVVVVSRWQEPAALKVWSVLRLRRNGWFVVTHKQSVGHCHVLQPQVQCTRRHRLRRCATGLGTPPPRPAPPRLCFLASQTLTLFQSHVVLWQTTVAGHQSDLIFVEGLL
jgi:hypothetical protein